MVELFQHQAEVIWGQQTYKSEELQETVLDISAYMMGMAVDKRIMLSLDDEKEMALCFLAGGFTDLEIYIIHPEAPLQKYDFLLKSGMPVLKSLSRLKKFRRVSKSNTAPQVVFSTSNTTKADNRWIHIPYEVLIKKAIMLKELLEIQKEDATYLFSPLCFIQSCWILLMFLYAGGTVYISKFDFNHLERLIESNRINILVTVPSIARSLLAYKVNMKGMKMLCLGGDFADRDLVTAMANAWPWLKYSNVYGCTETSAADIVLCPVHLDLDDKRIFSIGKQSKYSTVTIRKAETDEVAEINEAGVIWIDGKFVSNDTQPFKKNRVTGFCTGDIGYKDEDGYYFFQGRSAGMIKNNGMKVSAFEVEAVLRNHPSVRDAVVFGTSTVRYGECVNAVVCLAKDITFEELIKYLSGCLEKYKIPRYFYKTDEIIKTVSGKVCRQKEVLSSYILPENLIN